MDRRKQPSKNSDEGKSLSASKFVFTFGICPKVVSIVFLCDLKKYGKKLFRVTLVAAALQRKLDYFP